jgi:hypothetical protein
LKNILKPRTVLGRNRPEATAHEARRSATRDRPKSQLGHGLAAQPNGENSLRGPLQRAPVRSPRTYRVRDGAVPRSPAARRWLDGGKMLSASTGGVPGRRRARRAETGLTEEVGRRWGGGKWPARRRSMAAGSLRWSSTRVAGSCSSRETRG